MTWHTVRERHRLWQGDCLDMLRDLPDCSVDACVTDPPYGLGRPPKARDVLTAWLAGGDVEVSGGGFMGREWDAFVPGPRIWAEVLRVLKPGGHLICFTGQRTAHWMGVAHALAGFEARDLGAWIQREGMPKWINVSKAIDKMRHDRDDILKVTAWIKSARIAAGLTNRDIDAAFGFNGMAGHWTSQGSQPSVPTLEQVPPLLAVLGVAESEVPAEIRRLLVDLNGRKGQPGDDWHAREVVGKGKRSGRPGVEKITSYNCAEYEVTLGATERSRQWDGWNTQLNPAAEPWLLARKPLDGTIAQNVLAWGVGGLNIDGCRGGPLALEQRALEGPWPTNALECPKASTGEREQYTEGLELMPAGSLTGSADGSLNGTSGPASDRRNAHPTVKPLRLMRWLCRLVTPPGGTVLDPFLGSGTTAIAAHLEGFRAIGAEMDPRHFHLARTRLQNATATGDDAARLTATDRQPSLWGPA